MKEQFWNVIHILWKMSEKLKNSAQLWKLMTTISVTLYLLCFARRYSPQPRTFIEIYHCSNTFWPKCKFSWNARLDHGLWTQCRAHLWSLKTWIGSSLFAFSQALPLFILLTQKHACTKQCFLDGLWKELPWKRIRREQINTKWSELNLTCNIHVTIFTWGSRYCHLLYLTRNKPWVYSIYCPYLFSPFGLCNLWCWCVYMLICKLFLGNLRLLLKAGGSLYSACLTRCTLFLIIFNSILSN